MVAVGCQFSRRAKTFVGRWATLLFWLSRCGPASLALPCKTFLLVAVGRICLCQAAGLLFWPLGYSFVLAKPLWACQFSLPLQNILVGRCGPYLCLLSGGRWACFISRFAMIMLATVGFSLRLCRSRGNERPLGEGSVCAAASPLLWAVLLLGGKGGLSSSVWEVCPRPKGQAEARRSSEWLRSTSWARSRPLNSKSLTNTRQSVRLARGGVQINEVMGDIYWAHNGCYL